MYKVLEKEYQAEQAELGKEGVNKINQENLVLHKEMINHDQSLFKIAQEISKSLQVVLEFMDKGAKGLLTGDLSIYIV